MDVFVRHGFFFDQQDEVMRRKKPINPMVDVKLISKFQQENKDTTNVNYDTHCGFCLEALTDTLPLTKNLCGHSYHTQCVWMASEHGAPVCPANDCGLDWSWIIRQESRKLKSRKRDIVAVLLKRLKKRPDFKRDLQNLRTHLADVTKSRSLVEGIMKYERDDIVDKYADTLNKIQVELNDISMTVRNSEEYKLEKKAVSIARSETKKFFNKYHLSLRDLVNKDMLKLSWHARWAVEHNRGHRFVSYRSGIRLYPGRVKMFGYKNKGMYLPRRFEGEDEFYESENEEDVESLSET